MPYAVDPGLRGVSAQPDSEGRRQVPRAGHRHPPWCNAVHDLDPRGYFHIYTAKSEYPLPAGVTVKIGSYVSSDADQDREPRVEVTDEQASGASTSWSTRTRTTHTRSPPLYSMPATSGAKFLAVVSTVTASRASPRPPKWPVLLNGYGPFLRPTEPDPRPATARLPLQQEGSRLGDQVPPDTDDATPVPSRQR